MSNLGTATLNFNANTSNMLAGIDAVSAKLDGLQGKGTAIAQGGFLSSLTGQLTALGVAAGVGFGVLIYKVNQAIDRLAALSKTARDVGTDAGALKQLNYVAGQFGVTSASVAGGLKTLRDMFPGEDSIAAFEAVRNKMQELGPGAEAAAYAQSIFGERARELYPLLMSNNQEFEKFATQAKNFDLDNMDVKKVEDAKESITRLGNAWEAASNMFYEQIAVKVAPIIEWLAQMLEDWAADTTLGTETVNIAWEAFNGTIEFCANVIQVLYGAFRALFGFVTIGLSFIVDGLYYVALGIDKVVEAITGNVSDLAGTLDRASKSMKEFGMNQADAGINALTGEWWGDKWNKKRKELESKPARERSSFDNDYVPESLQEERNKELKAFSADLPKALEKNSADAFSVMAKFQAGMLVDRNKELQVANKQLKTQEDIKKELKKNKPKIAKF